MPVFTHRRQKHNPLFLLIYLLRRGLLIWFLLLLYEQGEAQSCSLKWSSCTTLYYR